MNSTTLAASASEAAPARSPARVVLAGRITGREAEAAIPAMALIEASVSEAFADFYRSIAAVGAFTLSGSVLGLSARLRAYERPQR